MWAPGIPVLSFKSLALLHRLLLLNSDGSTFCWDFTVCMYPELDHRDIVQTGKSCCLKQHCGDIEGSSLLRIIIFFEETAHPKSKFTKSTQFLQPIFVLCNVLKVQLQATKTNIPCALCLGEKQFYLSGPLHPHSRQHSSMIWHWAVFPALVLTLRTL